MSHATGKSTMMAKALLLHLTRLQEDASVKWLLPRGGALRDKSGGRVGCAYEHEGVVYVVLVQHVGFEATVATPLDALEHAMAFTKEALNLQYDVPWDTSDVHNFVWDWLEIVNAHCTFIWVLDGIDQFVPPGTVECVTVPQPLAAAETSTNTSRANANQSIGVHDKTSTSIAVHDKTQCQGNHKPQYHAAPSSTRATKAPPAETSYTHAAPQQDSLNAGAHKDLVDQGVKLIGARVEVQHTLCHWLLPLLDKQSPRYANTAYPMLRLTLVAAEANHPQRPIDPHLLNALVAGGTMILDMPPWIAEDRKAFVHDALVRAHVPEKLIAQAMPILDTEIKPVHSDVEAGNPEPQDKFGHGTYMHYFLEEVSRVVHAHHASLYRRHES
jgi:hypothetical protein